MLKHYNKKLIICGCDEAGRGCLAGPVVAAAVILPNTFSHPDLNDSKQISERKRDLLRPIIEKEALGYGIGIVSPKRIDDINILNASIEAMHLAIGQIEIPIDQLIIDGNKFKVYKEIKHECIIKGDGKFLSIAAASILAKTERDAIMKKLAHRYRGYGWESNKGYPTKAHREAVKQLGSTRHHRKTFRIS